MPTEKSLRSHPICSEFPDHRPEDHRLDPFDMPHLSAQLMHMQKLMNSALNGSLKEFVHTQGAQGSHLVTPTEKMESYALIRRAEVGRLESRIVEVARCAHRGFVPGRAAPVDAGQGLAKGPEASAAKIAAAVMAAITQKAKLKEDATGRSTKTTGPVATTWSASVTAAAVAALRSSQGSEVEGRPAPTAPKTTKVENRARNMVGAGSSTDITPEKTKKKEKKRPSIAHDVEMEVEDGDGQTKLGEYPLANHDPWARTRPGAGADGDTSHAMSYLRRVQLQGHRQEAAEAKPRAETSACPHGGVPLSLATALAGKGANAQAPILVEDEAPNPYDVEHETRCQPQMKRLRGQSEGAREEPASRARRNERRE